MIKNPCQWLSFDQQEPYDTVYQLQKQLVERRIQGDIIDTLLLGEHAPVITLGRKTNAENILNSSGIPVVEIERGGDVTYHGPGQLVGYPIFQLSQDERDLHQYLRNLEEVIIQVLATYQLQGERKAGWTGVWIKEQKIASIGVAVKKWVTYHGFALNITTDLTAFQTINPCGLSADVMTSLQAQLPDTQFTKHYNTILQALFNAFNDVFNREVINSVDFVPNSKLFQ